MASMFWLNGCGNDFEDGGQAKGIRASQKALIGAAPISIFAVLARHGASFDDRSIIAGGNVGVDASTNVTLNSLTSGFNSQISIGGDIFSQAIILRERSTTGNLHATQVDAPASVTTGTRTPFVAPPLVPAIGAFAAGTAPITVNGGQTVTLVAGHFGDVNVNGTLNLAGGLYQFRSLHLNNDSRLTALASAIVRVAAGITGLDRVHVTVASGFSASALRLEAAGTASGNDGIVFANDAQITGLVIATKGVRIGDRLAGRGAIAGQDVVLGHDTQFTADSGFGCSTAADCNDNNPCTVDACVDAQCQNSAAPNGTACSDGNACTQADACLNGTCAAGTPVVCTAMDTCHAAGTCDPATGVCSNPPRAVTFTEFQVQLPTTSLGGLLNGPDGNLWFGTSNAIDWIGRMPTTGANQTFFEASTTGQPSGPVAVMTNGPDGNIWFTMTEIDRIRRMTTGGVVLPDVVVPSTGIPGYGGISTPLGITTGPDGNIWFTEEFSTKIGRIIPSTLTLTEFSVPPSIQFLGDILSGPDGNLWYDGIIGNALGRIDVTGVSLAQVPINGSNVIPAGLVTGSDGNVWFGQQQPLNPASLGRVTVSTLSETQLVTPAGRTNGIVAGPDGNLWFISNVDDKIGCMTPSGSAVVFSTPTSPAAPVAIAVGSDGNIWFTEVIPNRIVRLQF
jgi:virginiamycin B lyase